MIQVYKKALELDRIEVSEIEEPKAQESIESEVDELIGDLNPKYFEEIMSLNEAKDKISAAKAYSENIFNPFGY